MKFRWRNYTYENSDESAVREAQATEIRLALVMNGGVSLAVWMGGVAHELDLLRRASRNDPLKSVAKNDRPVFEMWRDLAERAQKRVRVDVVSGTSAGGLNGLLLATAIGRRAALPDLRALWQSSASLDALLSGPSDTNSVLSGDFLQSKVKLALEAIKEGQNKDETVTLFVTATALDGQCRTFKDGFGQQFDIGDHRRVYRFRNQPSKRSWHYTNERENGEWGIKDHPGMRHFSSDNTTALLQAARATACFPLAFTPVSENPLLDHRVHPDPVYKDPASCVMDGGVLNNAPFGPVLEEITKRRVNDRPVERYLVYVVPSAARLTEEEIKGRLCHEIPLGTVALSTVNYPREVDIRSGTEDLKHRLETSVRGTREKLFKRLISPAVREGDGRMRQIAESLLIEYRRSRVNAVLPDTRLQHTKEERVTPLVPPPEMDDGAIEEVLKLGLTWFPSQDENLRTPDLKTWNWGIIAAERLLQTLGHYLHDLLSLGRPYGEELSPNQRADLVTGARVLSDQLRKAIAVRDAYRMERDRRYPPGVEMGAREAALQVDQVFKDLNIPTQLGELVDVAANCFLDTLKEVGLDTPCQVPADIVSAYLTVEVLTQTFAPRAKVVDELTPQFTFLRLGPDEMGPLFQEDWSADIGARKLYGIRFRHFGAFIKKDWRHSDFAWGRLDAAHYLLPLLLPHDNGVQERELHKAILAAEDVPGVKTNEGCPVERMRERLKELAESNDAQLLDGKAERDLRRAGDQLIQVGVKSWQGRLAVTGLWHQKWKRWLRRQQSQRR
ncbi:DUF3376 domain-containing protein [Streptomyces chartreusis]|uniref:DUF3376 domain-containing protein n=1 Tax=Streptomyces chartreusis TaxID=1969 RepID=UPI003804F48B